VTRETDTPTLFNGWTVKEEAVVKKAARDIPDKYIMAGEKDRLCCVAIVSMAKETIRE